MFVDNPVGTGYSYVENLADLTTDVLQIADDLVVLFSAFLERHPVFEVVLFCVCTAHDVRCIAPYRAAHSTYLVSHTEAR